MWVGWIPHVAGYESTAVSRRRSIGAREEVPFRGQACTHSPRGLPSFHAQGPAVVVNAENNIQLLVLGLRLLGSTALEVAHALLPGASQGAGGGCALLVREHEHMRIRKVVPRHAHGMQLYTCTMYRCTGWQSCAEPTPWCYWRLSC